VNLFLVPNYINDFHIIAAYIYDHICGLTPPISKCKNVGPAGFVSVEAFLSCHGHRKIDGTMMKLYQLAGPHTYHPPSFKLPMEIVEK